MELLPLEEIGIIVPYGAPGASGEITGGGGGCYYCEKYMEDF